MKLIIEFSNSILPSEEGVVNIQIDSKHNHISYYTNSSTKSMSISKISQSFQDYMLSIINEKRSNGRARTAEAYKSALNSLNNFVHNNEIQITEINDVFMEQFESFLKNRSVCMNTISFYMRILKAVYKRAVKHGLVSDNKPFEKVYTGIAKTQKRGLNISYIRDIHNSKALNKWEEFAKDMFMFSFYTRGMSFVDMAYLLADNVKDGCLYYKRRKTGQLFTIKWEQSMQEIVNKYSKSSSQYLLPIISRPGKCERSQYRYNQYMINKHLKTMGLRLHLPCILTMYVARHSWASIAKSIDVPVSIICDALGHSSEMMTSIYLKSIDENRIHQENKKIISLVND